MNSLADVTKNQYYPPAAIAVSKSKNKYLSSQLVVAGLAEDTNNMYFRLVYNVGDKYFEVESLTKKKQRIGQILS